MSSAAQQPEPSMEEILASIRRIISEDPNAEPKPEPEHVLESISDEDFFSAVPASAPEPLPEPVDEVLDLTPDMRADAPLPEPDPVFVPEPEPVFAPAPEPEPVPVAPEPVPEPVIERIYVEPAPPLDAPEIISPDKAAMASASLASFAASIQSATRVEGDTIENIVKTLLRPMLKEWMDNNLPAMVESQVQAELKRLAGRH